MCWCRIFCCCCCCCKGEKTGAKEPLLLGSQELKKINAIKKRIDKVLENFNIEFNVIIADGDCFVRCNHEEKANLVFLMGKTSEIALIKSSLNSQNIVLNTILRPMSRDLGYENQGVADKGLAEHLKKLFAVERYLNKQIEVINSRTNDVTSGRSDVGTFQSPGPLSLNLP